MDTDFKSLTPLTLCVVLFCERVKGGGRGREFVALVVTFTTRRPKVPIHSSCPAAAPLLQLSRKIQKRGENIRVKRHTIGQPAAVYSNGFQILRERKLQYS